MDFEEIQDNVDKLTQLVVAILCISVAGGIITIAAVALVGPQIAPLMQKLPF